MKPADVRSITQAVSDPDKVSRLLVVMLIIELVAIDVEVAGGFAQGGVFQGPIPVMGIRCGECAPWTHKDGYGNNVSRETIGGGK